MAPSTSPTVYVTEMRRHHGFTLIEVLVVLLLLGLAAALVAPIFLPRADAEHEIARLVRQTRDVAERRGETVHLTIATSGTWWMQGAASAAAGPLTGGRLEAFSGPPGTLVVSPIGTCAFDARSAAAAGAIAIDPLTCEVRAP